MARSAEDGDEENWEGAGGRAKVTNERGGSPDSWGAGGLAFDISAILTSAKAEAQRQTVDVDPELVGRHLRCFLCSGLYREPVTLPECMHSFCKSCLLKWMEANRTIASPRPPCPCCGQYADTGRSLYIADPTLGSLVAKLFSGVVDADKIAEAAFGAEKSSESAHVEAGAAPSTPASAAVIPTPPRTPASTSAARLRAEALAGITLHLIPATAEELRSILPGCVLAVQLPGEWKYVPLSDTVRADSSTSIRLHVNKRQRDRVEGAIPSSSSSLSAAAHSSAGATMSGSPSSSSSDAAAEAAEIVRKPEATPLTGAGISKHQAASGRVLSLCPPFARPWGYTAAALQVAALRSHIAAHCSCHAEDVILICARRPVTGKEHSLAFLEGAFFRNSPEAAGEGTVAPNPDAGPWIRFRFARRVAPACVDLVTSG